MDPAHVSERAVKNLLQRNEHPQPWAKPQAVRASDRFFLKLGDLGLIWLGLLLAIIIRTDFNWSKTLQYLDQETWFFITLSGSVILVFWLRGLYKRDWRYVGIADAFELATTLLVVFIPFELLTLPTNGGAFPRTGLIIAYFPILFLLAGLRMLIRISLEQRRQNSDGRPYLIIGSGDTAEVAVRELKRSGGNPVGFLTVEKQNAGSIRGCPYLGGLDNLKEIVKSKGVGGLILAGLTPGDNSSVVRAATELDLELRTLPPVSEVLSGEVQVNTMRALQLEDLLEREPVDIDREVVGRYLKDQVILVTGAGGSIGAEIVRQVIALQAKKVVLLGRGENSIHEILSELRQSLRDILEAKSLELAPVICDVRDKLSLAAVFQEHKPQVVFHAAAHKHVPLMESQPVEACANNIFGTLNVMELCEQYKIDRLVVLSTDKAVDPSSVMGATKRVTELLIHTSAKVGFAAVRFGNVLGSRGSVVPTLRKQIENGGPLTITSAEMTRFFMTIPEAVSLVLGAGSCAKGGEIYVLEMGKPVKIVDLAENLVRLSGLTPHKDIEFIYCGVRPGEKIHEELVYSQETATPAEISGLQHVSPKELEANWPGEHLDTLREAVEKRDQEGTREALFRLLDK